MADPYVADLVAVLDAQDETVEQLARCAVLYQHARREERRCQRRLDGAFTTREGRRLTGAEVETAAHISAEFALWRARRISAHRLLATAMDAWDATFARRHEPGAEVIDISSARCRRAS